MALDITQSSKEFLASIDEEISRLQHMRQQVVEAIDSATAPAQKVGKPVSTKRSMSPAARKRVGDAQRARWAKLKSDQKKITAKPVLATATKKASPAKKSAVKKTPAKKSQKQAAAATASPGA